MHLSWLRMPAEPTEKAQACVGSRRIPYYRVYTFFGVCVCVSHPMQIEEAVDAEPDLSDVDRTLLRAAAYDTYDMLLVCDGFLRREKTAEVLLQACLELLVAIAPGSESHAGVALKYYRLLQNREQIYEALIKQV